MKDYEIVVKYFNGCAWADRPITTFEEATLADPADYVRSKHARDFDKFTRETLPTGQTVYSYSPGGVRYTYEFTEL